MINHNLENLKDPFNQNILNLESKDIILSAPTLNTCMEEACIDVSFFEPLSLDLYTSWESLIRKRDRRSKEPHSSISPPPHKDHPA